MIVDGTKASAKRMSSSPLNIKCFKTEMSIGFSSKFPNSLKPPSSIVGWVLKDLSSVIGWLSF